MAAWASCLEAFKQTTPSFDGIGSIMITRADPSGVLGQLSKDARTQILIFGIRYGRYSREGVTETDFHLPSKRLFRT